MLYSELPANPHQQPKMMCVEGHGPWSAQRGDYFAADPNATVLCACGADMILVREVHYYEPA